MLHPTGEDEAQALAPGGRSQERHPVLRRDAGDHHSRAGPHREDGGVHSSVFSCSLHGRVEPEPTSVVSRMLSGLATVGGQRLGAQGTGRLEAMRPAREVGGQDSARPGDTGGLHSQEADGTAPENADGRTRAE